MRLHTEDPWIRSHSLNGEVGLELEAHRTTATGRLAQTDHPFPDDAEVIRDFSEEQIEINTPPAASAEETLAVLRAAVERVQREIAKRGEVLWPFSNPPYIEGPQDIRIAKFSGDKEESYLYRAYLAERYGKYKMTYSGIHFNYSFDEELLRRNAELEGVPAEDSTAYRCYKDAFYLMLAERLLTYAFVPVALFAASPLVDGSFYDPARLGETVVTPYASPRCSEEGYWNPFTPVLDYTDIMTYTDSIESYVRSGALIQARELYYPVRVKPKSSYTMDHLRQLGINHIEYRMVDVNPLADCFLDLRDAGFLEMLIVWLASQETNPLTEEEQRGAIDNIKQAAKRNWETTMIARPTGVFVHGQEGSVVASSAAGAAMSLQQALEEVLEQMASFYEGADEKITSFLEHQREKVACQEKRYVDRIGAQFGTAYVEEGLKRAWELQKGILSE